MAITGIVLGWIGVGLLVIGSLVVIAKQSLMDICN